MRNAIRFSLAMTLAVLSMSGLFATDAKACDMQCYACSPYGYYCSSLSTGGGYFCESYCSDCVPVTEATMLPEVNCKT